MAELKGTNVSAPILPFDGEDTFPTHYAKYGKGGHRTVNTLVEKNSIPLARRELLMTVSVIDTGKTYKLKSDSGNSTTLESDWEDQSVIGGGSGDIGTPIYKYQAIGSSNNDCIIHATGLGVTFSKVGNVATITPPEGVIILTARIRFSAVEIGTAANFSIIYDNTLDGADYTLVDTPTFQIYNDIAGNRALRSAACNLNINAKTMAFTGILANVPILVKLIY